MRKNFVLCFLLLISSTLLHAQSSWTQKADFGGTARGSAVGFSIGNKGYIGTGDDGSVRKDFWEYDAQNNIWTQKADLGGTARRNAVGFSIGDKGYIGTGWDLESNYRDFWEYDPQTNVWTQKADFGGSARRNAVGFSIGGKGYIGTGLDDSDFREDFWEFDPQSNTWTQKADFGGIERHNAVGFSIDNNGYIGTGELGSTELKDFWQYNPETDTWVQKADFEGVSRSNAVGLSIDSLGYIGGGFGGDPLNRDDFWRYDPETDHWLRIADFGGTPRLHNAVAFSIDNKGYVGTGFGVNELAGDSDEFWEYDPTVPYVRVTPDFLSFGGIDVGNISTPQSYILTGHSLIGDVSISTPIDFEISLSEENGFTNNITVTPDEKGNLTDTVYVRFLPSQSNLYENTINHVSSGAQTTELGVSGTGVNFETTEPWKPRADFGGTVREGAVGFSIGNKGYIGTGFTRTSSTSSSTSYRDFWEYDPQTNFWTQKADFGGTARFGAVGFSIGDKGYIGTGDDGSDRKDFWEYDPENNSWTQKTDFGGTARSFAVGFSIGDRGYIGTGDDDLKDFWEYDPQTNIWTQKADFAGTARSRAVGFSIGNKGYIGTGFTRLNIDHELKDFWEYDPQTNNWTQKADFGGTARFSAVGIYIGDKGYIGTGTTDDRIHFWEYNPETDTWTRKADSQGQGRQWAVGFSISDKGYIGTGLNGDPLKDFWEYDPGLDITPSIPQLVSPEDSAENAPINPVLRWTTSLHAASYQLQISDNDAFSNRVIDEPILSDTSFTASGLEYETVYYWRVRASNQVGTSSNWSRIHSFTTIIAPPGVPALIFPTDDSTNVPINPLFRWFTAPHAETYHLQLSGDSAFQTLVGDTTLSDTSFVATDLMPLTQYYWRVKGIRDGADPGEWSDILSFTTTYLADLSGDGRIAAQDLALFAQAWQENDLITGDIGPAEGTRPTLIPLRDGIIDFEDLMVFAQMWNWSVKQKYPAKIAARDYTSDSELTIDLTGEKLLHPGQSKIYSIDVNGAEDVKTMGMRFEYDKNALIIDSLIAPTGNDLITLRYIDNENGFAALDIATLEVAPDSRLTEGGEIRLAVTALNEFRELPLTLAVETFDSDAVRSGRAIKEFSFTAEAPLPEEFSLHQNYPNPFNPATVIRFELPVSGEVRLEVFDVAGRRVAILVDGVREAGEYELTFDASHLSSGIYFYRIQAGNFVQTRKLTLIK